MTPRQHTAGLALLDNLHVRLFITSVLEIAPGKWPGRNVQDSFWRFYRNEQDGGSLELPDSEYRLEGGRAYFIPAGVRFNCLNSGAITHFYVHFDVVGLPPLALRELFSHPICLTPAPAVEEEAATVANLLRGKRRHEMGLHCRVKALIYHGLALHLERLPAEQIERFWRTTEASSAVLPAIYYIEQYPAATLDNAGLARKCRLSEDYFIRRFRDIVGETPQQYVTNRRIQAASQYLLFSERSIEEIAAATGFANRHYFSRVFQRCTGLSPAAYRRSTRR